MLIKIADEYINLDLVERIRFIGDKAIVVFLSQVSREYVGEEAKKLREILAKLEAPG